MGDSGMAENTFFGVGWVVLTAVVAALMWAAQIPPKAAASNLSEWVEWCGLPSPDWLRSPSADSIVRTVGPFALALLAVVGAWIFLSETLRAISRALN
jgi:hypothetical protein